MKPLIGNNSTELDIRNWLSRQGYIGTTAQFKEIELHAVKRPGWLQVFRFEVLCMTAEGVETQLFGTTKSDERYGSAEFLADEDVSVRDEQLAIWSEDLITQKRHRR